MSNLEHSLFIESVADSKSKLGIQFLPTTVCPLPIKEPDNYRIETKSGKVTLDVFGGKYGVPHGRDNLIVLWLILLSRKQNSRKITNPSIYDFLNTFGIDDKAANFTDARRRLLRIIYSNWTWTITEQSGTGYFNRTINVNIISDSLLFWDPRNVGVEKPPEATLFEEYIELSEGFYDTIKNYKIPYRLEIVKAIQNAPTLLNLYLFLSYRTYSVWRQRQAGLGNGVVKIPLFGDNGLKHQLGSPINNRSFKLRLKGYLEELKTYWPNCPAELDTELSEREIKRKKTAGDRLVIKVKDITELDVIPNMDYEIAKSIKS